MTFDAKETPIHIQLRWGIAYYYLKQRAIIGKLLDGTDFRIEGIEPDPLADWIGGAFIQVAFPSVSAADRETLMSGISEKQFDEMCGESEDGDEALAERFFDPDMKGEPEAAEPIAEPRWPAERRVPRAGEE